MKEFYIPTNYPNICFFQQLRHFFPEQTWVIVLVSLLTKFPALSIPNIFFHTKIKEKYNWQSIRDTGKKPVDTSKISEG